MPRYDIDGPNYNATPPQANDLLEVLGYLLVFETEESKLNELLRWEERELPEKRELTSRWRNYGYYLHSLLWLGLVAGEGRFREGGFAVTPKGRLFIEANERERLTILRRILLQDEIFQEIKKCKIDGVPLSLMRAMLTRKIMHIDCKWKNAWGRPLVESTAKRRLSCAISWSRTLGIFPQR